MSQFDRRQEWDHRNLKGYRMDDMHWPACRTNCMAPRIGQSDTCLDGHETHECSCDEAARAHHERIAEASAEHLADIGGAPV